MSLDSSCMLLWWRCSTGSDDVSLVSRCVLLGVVVYHWIDTVVFYWMEL
jgi:hypothetical protein